MSIKGSPTQQKLIANQVSRHDFVTVQSSDQGLRNLLDTTTKFAFRVDNDSVPRTAGAATGNVNQSGGTVIEDTATPAKKGDFVRFETGNAQYLEIPIDSVSTNQIVLAAKLPSHLLPAAGDTFYIMRFATQRTDESGAQIVTVEQGPIRFTKDGLSTEVSQDTGTPSNSVPLPVQLYGAAGQINITAGDINVQTTHQGPNYDSQRIGDGTTELGITANNEAKTHDAEVLAKLTDIEAIDFATEAKQDAAILELQEIKALDFATEAKQDLEIAELQALNAYDFATSALQMAIANLLGATNEAAPAGDTADAALNGRLQRIAQNLSSLMALLPASLGQKAMADSLAVTLPSDQPALATKAPVNAAGDNQDSTISTVATLTAPANAVGFILMNLDTSDANIRWRIGASATASAGQQLQPGRDTGYVPCAANISVCAESGTQNYNIQWILSA